MKKVLLLAAATLIAGQAEAQNEFIQYPVRDDGMCNTYVIKGAKLTQEVITNNKVILPQNLTFTTTPDSEFTFYYPDNGGWFAACGNCVSPTLFPGAKKFEIDGHRVSRDEFYLAPAQLFTIVEGEGDIVRAKTRRDINESSAIFSEMADVSAEWYRSSFGKTPIPTDIVMNDPTTLPDSAFLNLNWVMTTREEAAQLPTETINGYMLNMFGPYPEMNIFNDGKGLSYNSGSSYMVRTEIISSVPKSLSVGDIASCCNIPPDSILLVKLAGGMITVFSMPNREETSE